MYGDWLLPPTCRVPDESGTLVDGSMKSPVKTSWYAVQRADARTWYVRERTDHRQGELLSAIERTTTTE